MTKNVLSIFFFLTLLLINISCKNDGYDAGEGVYSYLHADFGIITTTTGGKVTSFVTDDNQKFTFDNPKSFTGAKADTTYRALVYYKAQNNKGAYLMGTNLVSVIRPFPSSRNINVKTDPVDLISAWISNNGQYLNFSLGLKVGEPDNNTNNHIIGFAQSLAAGTTNSYNIILYHDQNGVPENYTITSYISIPLKGAFASGDKISVAINTYKGPVTKYFIVP